MEGVNELISDVVHSELTSVTRLAQLVHQKTHGNPFFAIAFLTKLYQTGLLVKRNLLSHILGFGFTELLFWHNSILTMANTNGDGTYLTLSR